MTRLLVTHLASKGVDFITIFNRSLQRPNELKIQFPDVQINVRYDDLIQKTDVHEYIQDLHLKAEEMCQKNISVDRFKKKYIVCILHNENTRILFSMLRVIVADETELYAI